MRGREGGGGKEGATHADSLEDRDEAREVGDAGAECVDGGFEKGEGGT